MNKLAIFWFRRDLRLNDNVGLWHALNSGFKVLPVFVFDTQILNDLKPDDKRVSLIYQQIGHLKNELKKQGADLWVLYGNVLDAFREITDKQQVQVVYTNEDYEPYAIKRDALIIDFLKTKEIDFQAFTDHVVFSQNRVLKPNGEPYTVYTPFSKKWKQLFTPDLAKPYPSDEMAAHFLRFSAPELPDIQSKMGFEPSNQRPPMPNVSSERLTNYKQNRDFPALNATSFLSTHLRFGFVSIREALRAALSFSETFLNELIWREFFIQILYHFPNVVHQSFKPQYDRIQWRNNQQEFERWTQGNTGFPIVDAGMRQLNQTGLMHNRVRMITASFLTKQLLIDWRWGEAYFAEKLLDYELASNNGNWQWAAGTGCDAAPYFRIFNPDTQFIKFDKDMQYVRKWVPEINELHYRPMLDLKLARLRTLDAYKMALNK